MIVIKLTEHKVYGNIATVCENEPLKGDNLDEQIACIKDGLGLADDEPFDIVPIANNIDMFVDDCALMKENPQPNWIATALRTLHWCKCKSIVVPCGYPPLCGNVVLVARDPNGSGNTIDLNDEQVNYIKQLVG